MLRLCKILQAFWRPISGRNPFWEDSKYWRKAMGLLGPSPPLKHSLCSSFVWRRTEAIAGSGMLKWGLAMPGKKCIHLGEQPIIVCDAHGKSVYVQRRFGLGCTTSLLLAPRVLLGFSWNLIVLSRLLDNRVRNE